MNFRKNSSITSLYRYPSTSHHFALPVSLRPSNFFKIFLSSNTSPSVNELACPCTHGRSSSAFRACWHLLW